MSKNNRIIVPCRLAYVNCWKPKSSYGGTEKYSAALVIPKEDTETVKNVTEILAKVTSESLSTWGGKMPPNMKSPLHDGDVDSPDNPIFNNSYYINAKSTEAPQIVDNKCNSITNHTELYSGCFANVSVVFHPYNFSGLKGISAWLGNIQKIKDGEYVGGRITAQQEFKPVQVIASDDYLN